METATKFSEIKTDYVDDNDVLHIDGYRTEDDNENGETIGYFINGEVYYRDPELQFDPYVADVVAELKKQYKPTKNRIVIELDGGLIQNVVTEREVEALVADYDVEGTDPTYLASIPQEGSRDRLANLYYDQIEFNPEKVESIFNLKGKVIEKFTLDSVFKLYRAKKVLSRTELGWIENLIDTGVLTTDDLYKDWLDWLGENKRDFDKYNYSEYYQNLLTHRENEIELLKWKR